MRASSGIAAECAARMRAGLCPELSVDVAAHGEVERVGLRDREARPAIFDHRLDGGMRGAAAHILDRRRRRFQQGLDQVAVAHEGGFGPVGVPGLGLEQQADAILDDAPVVLRRQDAPEIETAPIGVGTCGCQEALCRALPPAVDQQGAAPPVKQVVDIGFEGGRAVRQEIAHAPLHRGR
jgi:hypothetical protein